MFRNCGRCTTHFAKTTKKIVVISDIVLGTIKFCRLFKMNFHIISIIIISLNAQNTRYIYFSNDIRNMLKSKFANVLMLIQLNITLYSNPQNFIGFYNKSLTSPELVIESSFKI